MQVNFYCDRTKSSPPFLLQILFFFCHGLSSLWMIALKFKAGWSKFDSNLFRETKLNPAHSLTTIVSKKSQHGVNRGQNETWSDISRNFVFLYLLRIINTQQRIEIKMDYNNVPHKFTSKISAKLKEMKLILLRAQSKDMLWTKEYACFDSFSAKNRN